MQRLSILQGALPLHLALAAAVWFAPSGHSADARRLITGADIALGGVDVLTMTGEPLLRDQTVLAEGADVVRRHHGVGNDWIKVYIERP